MTTNNAEFWQLLPCISFIYPDMEHIAYEIKNRKYNTPPCLVR